MSWKEFYLSPQGRVTRGEYWQRLFLPSLGIVFVAAILDLIFGWASRESPLGVISNLMILAILYPTIIVLVKRLHDHNKSGWWCLVYFVPIVGGVWALIECGFLRGTVGDNRYGPDPLPLPYYTTGNLGTGPGRGVIDGRTAPYSVPVASAFL